MVTLYNKSVKYDIWYPLFPLLMFERVWWIAFFPKGLLGRSDCAIKHTCTLTIIIYLTSFSTAFVTKPRSWFWLLWDYWWAWSPMFLSAHHLYQAHLFHIMQSTLSSTPVPHHAINSPIKASSTFQSPPDRCTTQYEYMPANLCPEVFVFCQFLRNWELTRFSLSWLQRSSLNLWLRSLTRTLEHRVLEPGPQTLYPTRAFTTQFTSLFVLVVNKLTLIVL